jgi:hypothetical protein
LVIVTVAEVTDAPEASVMTPTIVPAIFCANAAVAAAHTRTPMKSSVFFDVIINLPEVSGAWPD